MTMDVVPVNPIDPETSVDTWWSRKLPPTFVIDFVGHNKNTFSPLSPLLRKCPSTRSTNITMGGSITSYFSYLQKIASLDVTQNLAAAGALNITSNIVHSSYQGIIPALQYTLHQPQDHKKISALIFNNPMLSDNNAIYHSVSHAMPLSSAIPGGSIILPTLVKLLLFKHTQPNHQPIAQLTQGALIQGDRVIIITHNDATFPLKDSQALYAFFKQADMPFVYLVHNDENNIDLINQNIDAILQHHNLPSDSDEKIDTDEHQPEVKDEWVEYLYSTQKTETLRKYFDRIVKTGLLAAFMWLMYKAGTQVYHDLYTQSV